MATIRINQLPHDDTPNVNDVVPLDNGTTRNTTIGELVDIGLPVASQAEAEAGTNNAKRMTPLRVAQAITSQGSAQFATTTELNIIAGQAEGYRNDAQAAAGVAEGHAEDAEGYAQVASASAGTATGAANTAQTSAGQAMGFRNQAEIAGGFAARWASDPEDGTPIDDGTNPPGQSAYHWSEKSKGFADDAAAAVASVLVVHSRESFNTLNMSSYPVGAVITINRWSNASRYAPARYVKVGSEPSHESKAQSSDGAWWELADREVSLMTFGAVADGPAEIDREIPIADHGAIPGTDNSPSLQRAIAFLEAKGGGTLEVPEGHFMLDDPAGFAFPSNVTIKGVPGKTVWDTRRRASFSTSVWLFRFRGEHDHINTIPILRNARKPLRFPVRIASAVHSNGVITVTTATPHGLAAGERFYFECDLSGANLAYGGFTHANGRRFGRTAPGVVLTAPTSTTLTYHATAPIASSENTFAAALLPTAAITYASDVVEIEDASGWKVGDRFLVASQAIHKSGNETNHIGEQQSVAHIYTTARSPAGNLFSAPQDFTDAYWSKLNVTLDGAGMSPDGFMKMTRLAETAVNSTHRVQPVTGVPVTAGLPYTLTVYAKAAERSHLRLFTTGGGAIFNLANGTVVSGSGTIEDVGGGVYRCRVTFTASGTEAIPQIRLMLDATTETYMGDTSSGLYLWGAVIEQASTPSVFLRERLIRLPGALREDYLVADDAKIVTLDPKFDCHVSGITFVGKGDATDVTANGDLCFHFRHVHRGSCKNNRMLGFALQAIGMTSVVDFECSDNEVTQDYADLGGQATGNIKLNYCIVYGMATENLWIRRNRINGGRHAIAQNAESSGTQWGITRKVHIEGNLCRGSYIEAISTHQGVEDLTIVDNDIEGANGGINPRFSRGVIVDRNRLKVHQAGIVAINHVRDVVITGNTVEAGDYCIGLPSLLLEDGPIDIGGVIKIHGNTLMGARHALRIAVGQAIPGARSIFFDVQDNTALNISGTPFVVQMGSLSGGSELGWRGVFKNNTLLNGIHEAGVDLFDFINPRDVLVEGNTVFEDENGSTPFARHIRIRGLGAQKVISRLNEFGQAPTSDRFSMESGQPGTYRTDHMGEIQHVFDDASTTWRKLTHAPKIVLRGTLTATRNFRLSHDYAENGTTVEISRSGGGAFDWQILNDPDSAVLHTMAINKRVVFTYHSGSWVRIAQGDR